MSDLEIFFAQPQAERDKQGFYQWRKMNQISTHFAGCFECGEKHYMCALAEIERLKAAKHD